MRRLFAVVLLACTLAACDPVPPWDPPEYPVHEGTLATTQDGQVISEVEVHGDIQINHDNVTIHHFKMVGGHLLVNPDNTGAVIEDCELDGGTDPGTFPAVSYARYELRRCYIHGFGEGPMANGDVVIENIVIHDFVDYEHVGAHQDAIQIVCGDNIIIRNNWLDSDAPVANAAIMIGTACGPVDNVLVEGNVLAGGGYAIFGGSDEFYQQEGGHATNVTIRNNYFATWHHNRSGWAGPYTNIYLADFSGNTVFDGPYAGQDVDVLWGVPRDR